MTLVDLSAEDLAAVRLDPVLFEQELDVRPEVAEAFEAALGFRAGRAFWSAPSGRTYAIDLGDFGRGRPSMALVYGLWPRYEPRPVDDDAIDEDLAQLCLWIVDRCPTLDRADVQQVIDWAYQARDRRRVV